MNTTTDLTAPVTLTLNDMIAYQDRLRSQPDPHRQEGGDPDPLCLRRRAGVERAHRPLRRHHPGDRWRGRGHHRGEESRGQWRGN